MSGFLRFACLFMAMTWSSWARAETPLVEADVQATITRQLDAITSGDGAGAFAIASPTIQTLFAAPQTFMAMVERGYPEIFRATSHRFLKLEMIDGVLVQRVLIGSERGSVVARYEMIEIDGRWRINGCSIEARQDA